MATKKKATASKASPKKAQSGKTSKSASPKAEKAEKGGKAKSATVVAIKPAKTSVKAKAPAKAPAPVKGAAKAPTKSAQPSPATKANSGTATPRAEKSVAAKPSAPPPSIESALDDLDLSDDLDDDLTPLDPQDDVSRDKADGPLRAYEPPKAPLRPLSAQAAAIIASDAPLPLVQEQGAIMLGSSVASAAQAARLLHELVDHKPELVVSLAEKFARGLNSKHKRVVQTSADALPAIARIAPAKVARHLELLKGSYDSSILEGRDGLVRTFAALCTASVAYQKRLEPSLTNALEGADGKTLLRWSRIVLPALKGEPHARARGVVEARLYRIPRAIAQQIADFLKIKLRVRY